MQQMFTPRLMPVLLSLAFAGSAAASGFQLQNQTGSGNGNAFAGAAATAEDAGTIFFNPAGMTYLPEGHSISLAGTAISRTIKYQDTGSTAATTGLGVVAPLVTSGNGGNAGGLALLPAGYWSYSLTPGVRLGLGVSPSFGNTTEYNFDFIGRNSGYYAKIAQFNINPSVAWKASEKVSLGFGLNFAHNETHFRQGYPITAAPNVNACAPLPSCALLNSNDNFVDIKGAAWAVGYNLGAMFQLTPATRLGLAYRSDLKFKLKGDWDANANVAGGAVLGDQQIKASLPTPANFSVALSHRLSDRLELLGDVTWTGWSVLDRLNVINQGTGAAVTSLSYNFKDTYRVGLGGNYQYNDQWKLRFGVAYDQAPVKSAADRTMTLPDSDRTWISFGAKYKLSQAASLDMGYTHIFFKAAETARVVSSSSLGTLQTIRGKWDNNSVDILSVQMNYHF